MCQTAWPACACRWMESLFLYSLGWQKKQFKPKHLFLSPTQISKEINKLTIKTNDNNKTHWNTTHVSSLWKSVIKPVNILSHVLPFLFLSSLRLVFWWYSFCGHSNHRSCKNSTAAVPSTAFLNPSCQEESPDKPQCILANQLTNLLKAGTGRELSSLKWHSFCPFSLPIS